MSTSHLVAALGALVVVAGTAAGSAAATPAEGDVVRTDLAKGTTDTPISIVTNGADTTVVVQGLLLRPGASSGWHAHPGQEVSVVTKGVVHLQTAQQCAPTAYHAGRAVVIAAGVPHVVVNRGTDDAEVVVTYTVPTSATLRADEPAGCP